MFQKISKFLSPNPKMKMERRLTWVTVDQHSCATKAASASIPLVLLPVAVESIRSMSYNRLRVVAVSTWHNLLAISTTSSTSIVHRLLQCLCRNGRLGHTPQLMHRPKFRCWGSTGWHYISRRGRSGLNRRDFRGMSKPHFHRRWSCFRNWRWGCLGWCWWG